MKPFQFSLEKLLNVRTIKEKQELIKLSVLNGEKLRIQELLNKLKAQKDKQEEVMAGLDPASPESFHAQRTYYHLEYLIKLEQEKIKEKLSGIDEGIEEQQGIILEKSKEKKVIEKLKEKAYDRYAVEARREENKINDDTNQNIRQWKLRNVI